MITAPWDPIDVAVPQAMCDAGEAESTRLSFKRMAPQTQREDPDNEFAKAVCVFANANGGDPACGVATAADVAEFLRPLAGESADALDRRLAQVLANQVEPRISGIRLREVRCERYDTGGQWLG
jgi:predicted HTH transcriptional regulator